jgi:ABC-type sugar transport system substrate-binding protein
MLGCIPAALGESKADKRAECEFVIVPKVVHPWFDQVNEGAKKAAKMIEDQTGSKVSIDYRAPQSADVVMQNEILERSIATKPDGIAVDLLDGDRRRRQPARRSYWRSDNWGHRKCDRPPGCLSLLTDDRRRRDRCAGNLL